MKILIIPSWYPCPGDPLRGIFLKEQAIHMGEMRPDWQIAIAVWGQRRYTLSLRNPFKTAAVLADFLLSKIGSKKRFLLPNVCEYHAPAIEWTKRWRQGNIQGMVRACHRILRWVYHDLGRIDLIHAHVAFPGGWAAMKLSQCFRIPYLISEHMGDFPFVEFRNADGSNKETITEPMRRARAIVAVSPSQAERIAARGFPKPQIIPNMVDDDFFRPGAAREKIDGPFVFFTLSAFKPAKGLGDLLQALALFWQQACGEGMDGVQLRIGGSGEMEKELHALARRLEVEPWVCWLGRLDRSQALAEYRACSCLVQPSRLESFSIVLLEAWACGKPVIATRCGGPESMVTPENGILVPKEDPPALARAMKEMFGTAREYDGSLIRRRALEKFSKAVVTRRLETLYREIAGKETGRP
jgi:glycosyltransferase involved in cell wall biosynthesis